MDNFKKILRSKFLYAFLLVLAISSIFISTNNIPDKIDIMANTRHKLDFEIPSVMTITSSKDSSINIKNDEISSSEAGSHNIKLSVMGIPVKNIEVSVKPRHCLIPSGMPIGVRINTNGVMVLALGEVKDEKGKVVMPSKDVLKEGDMITNVNGTLIDSKETLMTIVEKNDTLNMEIKRDDEILKVTLNAVEGETGENRIGVWVRDSTQGVGTLTYIDKENLTFGALGHGILDVDTRKIMNVRDGKIMKSNILDIKKGEKGVPGELLGDIQNKQVVGKIIKNTEVGIYGEINKEITEDKEAIPIGLKSEVVQGDASILCSINGDDIKEYDIKIEGINKYNMDNSKSMIIRITDEELLDKTNGIVQGMSGSPILQDGKIIGAVTHVFVNNPQKGYGIFIENMLSESNK